MAIRGVNNTSAGDVTVGGGTLVLDYGNNLTGNKLRDAGNLIFAGARTGGANSGRLILDWREPWPFHHGERHRLRPRARVKSP